MGNKSGLGITALLAACRRDHNLRDAGDRIEKKSNKKGGAAEDTWDTHAQRTTLEILREMDFTEELITESMERCGNNCLACIHLWNEGASF